MFKRIIKISSIIIFVLIAICSAIYFLWFNPEDPTISAEDRASISLMPLPAALKLGKGYYVLPEDLGIDLCFKC
jgi:hypothetical protein